MKIMKHCVFGLSLLALAACRSSEPATAEEAEFIQAMAAAEAPAAEEVEEVSVAEPVAAEAAPARMPEVRYYEIADT